jgi:hypothetical protein
MADDAQPQTDVELQALNNVASSYVEPIDGPEVVTSDPHASPEERLRAALRRQGVGVVVAPQAAPYGGEDEELVCGVCLDAPGAGQLATLWCCKNILCLKDAQMIGACPFCRQEPLVWELALPTEVTPYS